ncbi:putative lipoprotein [Mycobacterium kansasii 662]|nr:hypothetical protein [Mycobacterium kansasii]EUA20166.1 putative lipoprotein [Mycobacterium kansasii 662]OOK80490.1 putative lipoprotein [Mycobacterium kansasii]
MQLPAHRQTPGAVAAMTMVTLWLAGCHSTTTGRPVAQPENGRKDGPASTTSSGIGLPPMKHFRIGDQRYGTVHDCHVNGNAVTCTLSMEPSYMVQSFEGTMTGTLSGVTLTGTQTTHQRYPDETDRSCIWTTDTSDPVTYVFSLDGTVVMRGGPGEVHSTRSGSCTGSESGNGGIWESSEKWSVIE